MVRPPYKQQRGTGTRAVNSVEYEYTAVRTCYDTADVRVALHPRDAHGEGLLGTCRGRGRHVPYDEVQQGGHGGGVGGGGGGRGRGG